MDDSKRLNFDEILSALTPMQRTFCFVYLTNGLNGPAAARAAGYKNHAESARQLATDKVALYIQARLNEAGFNELEVKRRLEYFATGDMSDFLRVAPSERSYWVRADQHEVVQELAKRRGMDVDALDNYDISGALGSENVAQTEDGVLMACIRKVDAEVTVDWRGAEKAQALGRIKKIKIGKDGNVGFELHDPVRTLEMLGKAHGMFTDNVNHTGEVGLIGIRITPPESTS